MIVPSLLEDKDEDNLMINSSMSVQERLAATADLPPPPHYSEISEYSLPAIPSYVLYELLFHLFSLFYSDGIIGRLHREVNIGNASLFVDSPTNEVDGRSSEFDCEM